MWQKEKLFPPLRNKDIPTSASLYLSVIPSPLKLIKKYQCFGFDFLNSILNSPPTSPLVPKDQYIFLLGERKFLNNLIIYLASIIHCTLEFPSAQCAASPSPFSPQSDNACFSPYSALIPQESHDIYYCPNSQIRIDFLKSTFIHPSIYSSVNFLFNNYLLNAYCISQSSSRKYMEHKNWVI